MFEKPAQQNYKNAKMQKKAIRNTKNVPSRIHQHFVHVFL